jgi:death-on-curing protein
MSLRFVPLEVVLTIHADLLQRYGGRAGIRDRTLLESALAQPKMMIEGRFVHKTIFEKAAAYGYHLCKNHPFIDGNKRVALVLTDIFLERNGWEIVAQEEEAYAMMLDLASRKLTKAQLASWLKKHSSKLPRL